MESVRSSLPDKDPLRIVPILKHIPTDFMRDTVPGNQNKLRSVSPLSSAKAARCNKSSPYLIHQRGVPLGLSNMCRGLVDAYHPAYHLDAELESGEHQDTLDGIIRDLPTDVVRDAIRAQYADCEVTRYCVLAVSWELERLERWKDFHARSLKYLEERNTVSRKALDFWRGWCRAEGVEVQPQEQMAAWKLLDDECVTLMHMQRDLWRSEKAGVSLGAINGQDIFPAMSTSNSSLDTEDSSDSEVSRTEPETPHMSDLEVHTSNTEVPYTSDLEISYASDPEKTDGSDHLE